MSVLAAQLRLPEGYCVAYAIYGNETPLRHFQARRSDEPLLHSFLWTIASSSARLYVFRISSAEHLAAARAELTVEGTVAIEDGEFDQTASASELRTFFIDALRERLLDRITKASLSLEYTALRLNQGFIFSSCGSSDEWTAGWESTRTLVYCHLLLHLNSTRLLVQPLLLSTPYVPLRLPCAPGTPICLLPYATPAYFVSAYSGPTSALSRQFAEVLEGLGVSSWNSPSLPSEAQYVIAWILVENKQGEDKGLLLIYPRSLCLSYAYGPQSRPIIPLDVLPELPAALQSSPQPPSLLPSQMRGSPPPSSVPLSATPHAIQSPYAVTGPRNIPINGLSSNAAPPASPTSLTSLAFRALNIGKSRTMSEVAAEVASYVDAVTREREKERERLKRERESAGAPSPRNAPIRGTTAPTPSSSTQVPGASPSADAVPSIPQSSGSIQAPSVQPVSQQQTFYPSPPTNPPTVAASGPAAERPLSPTQSPASVPQALPSTDNDPNLPNPAPPESSHSNAPHTSVEAFIDASDWYDMNLDMNSDVLNMGGIAMNLDFNMDLDFGPFPAGSSSSTVNPFNDTPFNILSGSQSMPHTGKSPKPSSLPNPVPNGITNPARPPPPPRPPPAQVIPSSLRSELLDLDTDFTEDDFSFFDKPTSNRPTFTSGVTPADASLSSALHGPVFGTIPDLALTPDTLMSSIPTSTPPHTFFGSAGPSFISGFSGGSSVDLSSFGIISPPSEASPHWFPMTTPGFEHMASAGATPQSHAALPMTPAVHVEGEPSSPSKFAALKHDDSTRDMFSPIQFAEVHRRTDGKYSIGKFQFRSPSRPPAYSKRGAKSSTTTLGRPPTPPWDLESDSALDSDSDTYDAVVLLKQDSLQPAFAPNPTEATGQSLRAGKGISKSWDSRYRHATDPRHGVVQKLIGIKRKRKSNHPSNRGEGRYGFEVVSSSWAKEYEDWDTHRLTSLRHKGEEADDFPDNASMSSISSDSDSDEMYSPLGKIGERASTPLPSYLPPGPSLLATRFSHDRILHLCKPLTSSPNGVQAGSHLNIAPSAAMSVPTPVSPAAMLGAMSEKSRSLEETAISIAKEVVENELFGDAWKSLNTVSNISAEGTLKRHYHSAYLNTGGPMVSTIDINSVKRLLDSVEGIETNFTLPDIFDHGAAHGREITDSILKLEAPMITVGKGEALIDILPSATRFWEKLGLSPKAGSKPFAAFVIYPDQDSAVPPEDRQLKADRALTWLKSIAAAYSSKRYGELALGSHVMCLVDGVIPCKFDSSFRKTLLAITSDLSDINSNVVFFVLLPYSMMALSSPFLRQILSATKKAKQTASLKLIDFYAGEPQQLFFHFLPEHVVFGSPELPAARNSDTDALVRSVYDRMLQPVDRFMSRRFFPQGQPMRSYFQAPAYTLARSAKDTINKAQDPIAPLCTVSFSRSTKASLDVIDKGMFLHVGYGISPCKKWIIAACINENGDTHKIAVWLARDDDAPQLVSEQAENPQASNIEESASDGEAGQAVTGLEYVVGKVWEFTLQFARNADVEWRILISKLGNMQVSELEAWKTRLASVQDDNKGVTAMQVSLLVTEPRSVWHCIPTSWEGALTVVKSSPLPSKPSTTKFQSANGKHTVFLDTSSTTYAFFPNSSLPIVSPPNPPELGIGLGYVTEDPKRPLDASSGMALPLASSALIRVTAEPTSDRSIANLWVHLIHTCQFVGSPPSPSSLIREVTSSFHTLAVLSSLKRRNPTHPLLPFHLDAVLLTANALCTRDLDLVE